MKYLAQSGVYFLFGSSEDSDKDFVYIGQAGTRKNSEGILLRLKEHKGEKDEKKIGYWNETVVFTTSNNSFGPTEISYLENRFCNLAKAANRYDVKNGNDPSIGNVTEEKESELEEFIEYAQLVMGALGFKVFEPLIASQSNTAQPEMPDGVSDVLELTQGAVLAKGVITNNGFVILKGSLIKLKVALSCPKAAKKEREVHAAKISEDGILSEDIQFKSPNIAAAFATGNSVNAREAWKTVDGKSLNDLENNEASEV
ncbi:MAG: GIY-YIG nuclease family protein [Mycoplasmataceae bacterium]|jgi:hypothetical protein|nr:GIY-YIG nuclease family protein [Mycoplasmataceae bacterium]